MTTTFAERLAALIKVIKADVSALYAHAASVANPHAVTKSQVGLGNADNTSDASKPVSTATQTALDGKQPLDATLTALAGVVTAADKLIYATGSDAFAAATLTAAGRALIDDADAAAQRATLGLGTLATQSGTFSGTSSGANTGDQTIALTGDVTGSGTGSFAATIAANAVTLAKMATMATASFLGRTTAATGNVEVLSTATVKTMLAISNVDNTSDINKPISSAAQAALDALPSDFELGSAAYVDMVRLYGAATYDPPSLTANTATTTTVTVPGAEFGDFVYPSFNADIALSVTGRVSAANTVTLTYANLTASTVDAASHTVYVQIEKRLPL